MGRGSAFGAAPLVVLVFALVSCKSAETTPPAIDASVEPPPPPAPDDLLIEAVVPTPDASWGKLQRAASGSLGLMPSSLGGLVTALAGVDGSLAQEVDGAAPVYFAASGKLGDPAWVVSAHLVDARHARALAIGDGGRFTTHDAHGMTVLTQTAGLTSVAVAFDRDRIVVARKEEDLDVLGAYASRALPKKPTPGNALVATLPESGVRVVSGALGGAWSELSERLSEKEKSARDSHAGKDADFADTQAVMALVDSFVKARVAEVSDFRSGVATLDLADDGLHVATLLTPKDGDGPAHKIVSSMQTGDAKPLAASYADARASILLRVPPGSRAEQSQAIVDGATRALGSRLGPDAKTELGTIAKAWEKGAGDAIVISLPTTNEHAFVAKTTPQDKDAAKSALSALPALLRQKAFAEPLSIASVTVSKKDVPEGGAADIATIERKKSPQEKKPAFTRPPTSLAWMQSDDTLLFAAGEDAFSVLASAAHPKRVLGDDHALAAPLDALGSEAALAIVWQPLKLEPSQIGEPPAPVVLAWGKRGSDALVRVDVSLAALKGLVKKGSF